LPKRRCRAMPRRCQGVAKTLVATNSPGGCAAMSPSEPARGDLGYLARQGDRRAALRTAPKTGRACGRARAPTCEPRLLVSVAAEFERPPPSPDLAGQVFKRNGREVRRSAPRNRRLGSAGSLQPAQDFADFRFLDFLAGERLGQGRPS